MEDLCEVVDSFPALYCYVHVFLLELLFIVSLIWAISVKARSMGISYIMPYGYKSN